MEKIKLQTHASYKWGQVNILPAIGEVQISSEGFVEVDTIEQAEEIVSCIEDFYVVYETPDSGLTEDNKSEDLEKEEIPTDEELEQVKVDETSPVVETPADIVNAKKQAAKNLIAAKQNKQ